MKSTFKFTLALGLAVVLCPRPAAANPRPLPFTYPYATLPKGELELELYSDVTPLRVHVDPADPSKGRLWAPMYQLQNEFEYGITDRLEVGFYQVFEANPVDGGDNSLLFDGLKFRLRTRLANAGEWPVDVGLYFELETMHDELSFEGKVNLERDFGKLRVMTNLWAEESIERPLDSQAHGQAAVFIINPTLGATYELTPGANLGAEYWARGELAPSGEGVERADSRVHHFVGPALHLNFGKLWWSLGVYVNANSTKNPPIGSVYGPVWARSVIGLEL
ncbi:MAG TPA: hypothetical protein VMI54_21665 [Polyangiaceae bacterium]|nr:hypothetical protein [Polyangiaceae bacterium]